MAAWKTDGRGISTRPAEIRLHCRLAQEDPRVQSPLENTTLSSSHGHVDASHVTQIKIGVWPGTGFEWQMVSTFSVRKFRLGILVYLSRNSRKFLFGETKLIFPFTFHPNFRIFSVNGKQPSWIIKTSCLCDNTDLGFDNSLSHAQPHPIIVYCQSRSFLSKYLTNEYLKRI